MTAIREPATLITGPAALEPSGGSGSAQPSKNGGDLGTWPPRQSVQDDQNCGHEPARTRAFIEAGAAAPAEHASARPRSGRPGNGSAGLFSGRRMAWLGSFGALVLFPDLVFHLVLQILHFAIGSLELAIEHALQEALEVSRHTAQIMTAWLGLAALAGLAVWLYRKLRAAWAAHRDRLAARIRRLASSPSAGRLLWSRGVSSQGHPGDERDPYNAGRSRSLARHVTPARSPEPIPGTHDRCP